MVLGPVNDAITQHLEPSAPVHLPLQKLQPMHLALRLAIAPWIRESGSHGVEIARESGAEPPQRIHLTPINSCQPLVEVVALPLPRPS